MNLKNKKGIIESVSTKKVRSRVAYGYKGEKGDQIYTSDELGLRTKGSVRVRQDLHGRGFSLVLPLWDDQLDFVPISCKLQ